MMKQLMLCPPGLVARLDRTARRAMRRATLRAILLALTALATRPTPARSRMMDSSAIEMARRSDVVLVARVAEISKDTARVDVLQVLKGAPTPARIEVAPVNRAGDAIATPVFEAGQEALLFLRHGQPWTIGDQGWDTITLRENNKASTIEGVQSLLALLKSGPNKAATDRAMLKWATNPNLFLRSQAHRYIALDLGDSKQHAIYKAELLQLLAQPGSDVRATALQALRFVPAEEALPQFIQASRDADLRVAQDASLVLGQYDTPESVAALIALTRHESATMRIRALIDLDNSRRPEAKAALAALLDDADPKVRALAPRGLVMWLQRGESPELIPRLLQMLADPAEEVQVGAARELGESRDARALAPLLQVLERPEISEELEKVVVGSLGMIYERAQAAERQAVDDKIELVIAALKRGRWVASLNAVGLLAQSPSPRATAALRQAAESHPLQDIREYAARSLPK